MPRSEHLLYRDRNVVAYPQNPDAVAPLLGLRPQDLPKTLAVQFVEGARENLRKEPSSSVGVARLRVAFHWLTSNNWLWMLAKEQDLALPPGSPGTPLGALLRAYAASVGAEGWGVPAEVFDSATPTHASQSPIQRAGPSDALAGESDGKEANAPEAPSR